MNGWLNTCWLSKNWDWFFSLLNNYYNRFNLKQWVWHDIVRNAWTVHNRTLARSKRIFFAVYCQIVTTSHSHYLIVCAIRHYHSYVCVNSCCVYILNIAECYADLFSVMPFSINASMHTYNYVHTSTVLVGARHITICDSILGWSWMPNWNAK